MDLTAAAEGAVSFGGGALGQALGAAAELAELRGHPLLRAEETFQKGWKIEVRIQFREVNAEARRAAPRAWRVPDPERCEPEKPDRPLDCNFALCED